MPNGHNERVADIRQKVETAKDRVRNLQQSLGDAKKAAEGQWPRQPHRFRVYDELKKEWTRAVSELGALKAELTLLSGTTGSDPRWKLIYEAYHVLSDLEDSGVDIGKRGMDLLEDIEFHCPTGKLQAHGVEMALPSESVEQEPKR